jgi:hypothetical protein
MATTIQVVFDPRDFTHKLTVIVRSLTRDCHFQIFELLSSILSPCTKILKPVLGMFSELPKLLNSKIEY